MTSDRARDGDDGVDPAIDPGIDSGIDSGSERADWWYRTSAGDLFGPYTLEELRRYAAEGRIEDNGSLRRGDDGDWREPASVLRNAASGGVGDLGAPPIRRIPPSTNGAADGASPVSRTAYILLGLLPFLLASIGGIHNLVAGRTGAGIAQLLLCVIGIWGFGCIGLATNGLGWCLSVPAWFGLLVWTIVDVSTVTTDGTGRRLA